MDEQMVNEKSHTYCLQNALWQARAYRLPYTFSRWDVCNESDPI